MYYLIYLALPVVGATSLVPAESPAGGPFAHLMRVIYDNFEPPGASFPSSHVGIAVKIWGRPTRFLVFMLTAGKTCETGGTSPDF